MARRFKTMACLLIALLLVLVFPMWAAAEPGIDVTPEQYDFGEVEVGASASTQIEISNAWWGNLSIDSVEVFPAGSDFTLINPLPSGTIIPPGSVLTFGVEFRPTVEGLATAIVEIEWVDGESGTSVVFSQCFSTVWRPWSRGMNFSQVK